MPFFASSGLPTGAINPRDNRQMAPHPSYSPDLGPSDFHQFALMKNHLAGTNFANENDVKHAVRT